MSAFVNDESTTLCTPIIALIAGKRTLTGMRAFVHSEMPVSSESAIAFVAGVRTLTGMSTRVYSEITISRTSIIAFAAGERALFCTCELVYGDAASGCFRSPCWLEQGPIAVAISQHICCVAHFKQFAAFCMRHDSIRVAAGGCVIARFLLEHCLNGAQNQILVRPQIASKFSLERLPNAARRQLLASADGGADESCDRGLENPDREDR